MPLLAIATLSWSLNDFISIYHTCPHDKHQGSSSPASCRLTAATSSNDDHNSPRFQLFNYDLADRGEEVTHLRRRADLGGRQQLNRGQQLCRLPPGRVDAWVRRLTKIYASVASKLPHSFRGHHQHEEQPQFRT